MIHQPPTPFCQHVENCDCFTRLESLAAEAVAREASRWRKTMTKILQWTAECRSWGISMDHIESEVSILLRDSSDDWLTQHNAEVAARAFQQAALMLREWQESNDDDDGAILLMKKLDVLSSVPTSPAPQCVLCGDSRKTWTITSENEGFWSPCHLCQTAAPAEKKS